MMPNDSTVKPKSVLFVCTGNTCRSPMAEALFNLAAEKYGISARAFSRGIFADGSVAEQNAVDAISEYGADIDGRVSVRLTAYDLDKAELVVCMTKRHESAILSVFPEFKDKIRLFPHGEISDPYGLSVETYRRTAGLLSREVEALIEIYYGA